VIEKLRQLRPDSAQYHTAVAWIKYNEWQFDEEIAELELALRADPKFLRAHGFYAGIMLRACGDSETARRHFRIAEEIDPRDVIIQMHLGTPYYFNREYGKAIEQYQRAAALEPRNSIHGLIGRAYEGWQKCDQAFDEYELDEKCYAGTNVAAIDPSPAPLRR
jgi:tetratricopeptide (TPR) repeat protein